jgi:hypothetical protein
MGGYKRWQNDELSERNTLTRFDGAAGYWNCKVDFLQRQAAAVPHLGLYFET